SSRKHQLFDPYDTEDHRHRDLQLAVRDPAEHPRAQVGADHTADDEEERSVQVDLRRPLAEVVDGQRRDCDRDDRHERVRVGEPLWHTGPQHLQRDEHEAAAHTQETSEQAAQKADRGEDAGAAYSVDRGGVSGWFTTTEWCRNWTFDGTAAPGSLAFFFFFASRPCLSRPLPMALSFHDQGQFAQERFDVGDQTDRLPAAAVGELGHHSRVDVDTYGAHARGQYVAGADGVPHGRTHARDANSEQRRLDVMDGERVAGEEHLDETELDQAREIDARPGVHHGGSSHDQDAPARLSYVAHLMRDAGDENLLRLLGRHLAAHEAEDLGLPGALERRDAHALMADHHLHPRFSVLEDDAPGATRLAVDRDR